MLEFFLDFISPNAYLAWPRVVRIAAQYERKLVIKPVLFAALLQAHGQVGPAEVRPKMKWMVRNCLRKAKHSGIPLHAPATHPFNPLLALRVCHALRADTRLQKVVDAIFSAAWSESSDISDVAVISDLLTACDCDADTVLEMAGSPANKAGLRDATDDAIAHGVFGVPSVIVDNELFFGYDDLDWLQRFLSGELILDAAELRPWDAVRPSAWRRQK